MIGQQYRQGRHSHDRKKFKDLVMDFDQKSHISKLSIEDVTDTYSYHFNTILWQIHLQHYADF